MMTKCKSSPVHLRLLKLSSRFWLWLRRQILITLHYHNFELLPRIRIWNDQRQHGDRDRRQRSVVEHFQNGLLHAIGYYGQDGLRCAAWS